MWIEPGPGMGFAKRWTPIVARFMTVQSVIYGLNLLSGIALVRVLPPAELAFFTIAFWAFTVLSVLGDGGVGSAMTALGAQCKADPVALRGLVLAALRTRYVLAAAGAAGMLPVMWYSLGRLGMGSWGIATASALALIYVGQSVSGTVYSVVLRLHGRFQALQWLDLLIAALRLGFTVAIIRFVPTGTAALVLLVGLGTLQLVIGWLLSRPYLAAWSDEHDFGPRIARVVRHALPGVVFFALQGQVTVGLLSLFGTRSAVAGAGALSRIAVVYSVLGPLVVSVVAPRFALLPSTRVTVVFGRLVAGAALAVAVLFAAIAVGRHVVLSVLGPAYSHLQYELLIIAMTASLGCLATLVGELNKARAWLRRSWIVIPTTLGVQVLGAMTLPIGTLRGALLFGLVSTIPGLGVSFLQAWMEMRAIRTSIRAVDPDATPASGRAAAIGAGRNS